MMLQEVFRPIVDDYPEPIVFVDNEHIIRYLNKAASQRYAKKGHHNLVGQSLLACHQEKSGKKILDTYEQLRAGSNEEFLYVNDGKNLYMTAVRDKEGILLGYYERFENPRLK